MIAVIDYGAGNLRSAVRALEHIGAHVQVTQRPADLPHADAVVLPGVGATRDTMAALHRLELAPMLPGLIASGIPFLGICVGMQVLAEHSEEWGLHPCLGVLPGTVRRFPTSAGKIPQIGWNQMAINQPDSPLVADLPPEPAFYFVHGYWLDTSATDAIAGTTTYGIPFPALLHRGNVAATQFHPEKSGRWGLHLLHNWLRSLG